MSRNGSGTYVLPTGNPVVTGTTITSNWANTTFSDVATALTGSIAADGQTPMTGPLAMGNNKITGVADGTASSDVATVNQISNPNITGGSIDGTPIGNISPSTGKFTTLSANAGATLAGTCTAPTVTPGSDNTTKIATTAFVQSAISAVSSGVTSFNSRSGAVTLSSGDVTGALGYTPYNNGGATVITTGNIGSYAPGTTGSGASGNWGINITGNAATVTNGVYTNTNNTFTGTTNTFSNGIVFGSGSGINGTAYNFNANTSIAYGSSTIELAISSASVLQAKAAGTYNATGVYGTISDSRIKENVAPARSYLSDICKLNVVTYSLKKDKLPKGNMLGFIAQDVEAVMPGLIDTAASKEFDLSDLKSIKTSVLIPMLVQAIQELKAEIDTLKGV